MAKKSDAPAYVSLAPNHKGRDFTVGIIDRTIFSKLEAEGFNPSTDRLIYVGEILSPSSRPSATLCTLLNKGYFHAVRDQATASFLSVCTDNGMYDYEGATDHGFNWLVNEGSSGSFELGALATTLRKLPTVIDIPTPQGLVGFAPGIVPSEMTWTEFTKKIEACDRSVLDAVYYGHEADSIQGIDKLCIGSRHPANATADVASVGAELTEISALFKIVSILSKVEPAAEIVRQPLLTTAYRSSAAAPIPAVA